MHSQTIVSRVLMRLLCNMAMVDCRAISVIFLSFFPQHESSVSAAEQHWYSARRCDRISIPRHVAADAAHRAVSAGLAGHHPALLHGTLCSGHRQSCARPTVLLVSVCVWSPYCTATWHTMLWPSSVVCLACCSVGECVCLVTILHCYMAHYALATVSRVLGLLFCW